MAMAVELRCQSCGARNYRECECPWHRPFDQWPPAKLAHLKRGLNTTPINGS